MAQHERRLRAHERDVATLEAGANGAAPPIATDDGDPPPQGYVRLLHASYNRFVLGVRATRPALLLFAQPYSRNWHATLGGTDSPVGIANGAFVGVAVPAGESVVELRYDSAAARAGTWLSLATAWGIALAAAARLRGRGVRIAASVAATVVVAATLLAWERSLHGGRHLGTTFQWKTPGWAAAASAPAPTEKAKAP